MKMATDIFATVAFVEEQLAPLMESHQALPVDRVGGDSLAAIAVESLHAAISKQAVKVIVDDRRAITISFAIQSC